MNKMITSFIALMMYSVDKCSHGDAFKIHRLCRRTCIEKMMNWILINIYSNTPICRAIITTDTSNVLKEISKAKFYFSLCYRY